MPRAAEVRVPLGLIERALQLPQGIFIAGILEQNSEDLVAQRVRVLLMGGDPLPQVAPGEQVPWWEVERK